MAGIHRHYVLVIQTIISFYCKLLLTLIILYPLIFFLSGTNISERAETSTNKQGCAHSSATSSAIERPFAVIVLATAIFGIVCFLH